MQEDIQLQGMRIFETVDRLLDDRQAIIEKVDVLKEKSKKIQNPFLLRQHIAAQIIEEYSNRSAFAGGLNKWLTRKVGSHCMFLLANRPLEHTLNNNTKRKNSVAKDK